jgi:hypothetical protein
MATLQDILGGGLPAGLLSQVEQAQAEERAKNLGLLNLSFGLLQASRGAPGQRAPSLGQVIGQAGPVGVQAYQQSFDDTLKRTLQGMQIAEAKRKQQVAEQLRTLGPRLIQTTPGQPEKRETFATETGDYTRVTPGTPASYNINMGALPALAALGPEGIEYATNLAKFQDIFTPKTSIQKIYDAQGREITIRYNERTGEYTPLGGAKAEPFVQVDRGNVIELRRPTTGEVVGSVEKGAAPTAPSYTMTETGQVLNTKTGQLVQPTDAQGRPVVVDLSHKANDSERLASGFYMRMADASNTMRQPILDKDGKPVKDNRQRTITIEDASSKPEIFAEIVGGIIPNWMGGRAAQNFATSAVRQQYEQAQANWVTANLRKESGAVITPEEMQAEIRKWFPVTGNTPEVIEQKRKARLVAEESMRRSAGRALTVQQQRNVTVDY